MKTNVRNVAMFIGLVSEDQLSFWRSVLRLYAFMAFECLLPIIPRTKLLSFPKSVATTSANKNK